MLYRETYHGFLNGNLTSSKYSFPDEVHIRQDLGRRGALAEAIISQFAFDGDRLVLANWTGEQEIYTRDEKEADGSRNRNRPMSSGAAFVDSMMRTDANKDAVLHVQNSDALTLMSGSWAAFSKYFQGKGTFPSDNFQVGVAGASNIRGQFLISVEDTSGDIVATFGNAADAAIFGRTLSATPSTTPGSVG